jgi:hypothetical protein
MLWFWCGIAVGCLGMSLLGFLTRTLASSRIRGAAANRVLRLIETDPDSWQLSQYSAWHFATGICIWHAANDWDLTVNDSYPPSSTRPLIARALRQLRDRQLSATIDRAIAGYATVGR